MAVSMEDVIDETGGCGRFQIIVSLCVHFAKGFLCFAVLFMMFGGLVPDWRCVDGIDSRNVSLNQEEFNGSFNKTCSALNGKGSCQKFMFDSSVRTIVSEWSLVCESAWIVSTITSIQMAGLVVGNTLGGHFADAIGRKPTFLGTMVANTILNVAIIFVPSWIVFAVLRFFIGVACGFQLTVMYNIPCEFAPTHWRSFIVAAPSWPLSVMFFAFICWLLRDWRHVHIAIAVFGAVSVISCWIVQESFRWRVAHNQIAKAFKIVKFVAKVNKMPPPSVIEMEALAVNIKKTEMLEGDRKYSFVDLFRSRTLMKYTLCLSVIWFSVGLSVYGIQFGMSAISGSFYANVAIYSAIQIPIIFILHWLQNSIGRRKTFALYLFIFTVSAAVAAISYRFKVSDARNTVSRVCALIAVSVIGTAFTTMQIITIEIYPTVVRNIGYGMQNTLARVGSIVGPQLAFMETTFPGMMYIVCTIFGIMSIVMLKLLPETMGANLQDKLHEVNRRNLQFKLDEVNDENLEVKLEEVNTENVKVKPHEENGETSVID